MGSVLFLYIDLGHYPSAGQRQTFLAHESGALDLKDFRIRNLLEQSKGYRQEPVPVQCFVRLLMSVEPCRADAIFFNISCAMRGAAKSPFQA